MKLTRLITTLLFTATAFLGANIANAADVDPLWSKVIAQNNAIKKWAAKDIEQIVVATKDGDPSKTINIKKQLSGWEKNKANYTVLSITPPPSNPAKTSKPFDLAELFAPIEAEIFSSKATVKRSDGQTLNGKAVVLFEVTNSEAQVKIWVDGNSGALQKRVVEMSVPLTMEGNLTTNYVTDASGQSLPKDAETKLNIKIPFKKVKYEIKDTYTNWTAQP
ncbi:hypothetical protein [Undibacterium flavidum]|uniref:Uncharacterized protein n=1 Tax=Undibacterium flavidum TaxID=2762297 RepID=A0ABR6YA05_9BURK|nr:hypothetical protein [Undibacterium flavidum]MBC3873460.1 hypothetical protein [Undibacterium flavidum]